MTVIPIRKLGDPVLRKPAAPVTDFDGELRALVRDLRETLSDSGGAGLAAPQLGVGLRVFVWSPKISDGSGPDHLVNPVVDFRDEEEQLTAAQRERWMTTLRAASWFDEGAMPELKRSPHQ